MPIEFVDAEPSRGEDDVLSTGPGRNSRVAWVTALVVVVAGVAVGVLTRHDDTRPVAAPASISGSVSPIVVPGPELPTTGFTESITSPECRVGVNVNSCRFDFSTPDGVRTAIQAHLGSVSHLRVATVQPAGASTAVRRRTIAGQAGEDNVQIDIRPASAGQRARSGTSYVGAFATVFATELQHGLAVTVSASGPQTQTPSVVSVSALAADPRLLSVA